MRSTDRAISEADIKTLYEKLDRLSDGDVLVMAGSIPDVMPQTIYMDIMKYLADKDLKIVVDATKDLLVNVLQYHPFLIKPNNHELGEIFGVELKTRESVVPYAKQLQEKGAQNVLVSMAGEGAVLVAASGEVFEAPAPKAVDIPATTPQEAAPSDTKPEQADIARQPATDVVHVESLDEISAEITPETTVEIPADAPVIE